MLIRWCIVGPGRLYLASGFDAPLHQSAQIQRFWAEQQNLAICQLSDGKLDCAFLCCDILNLQGDSRHSAKIRDCHASATPLRGLSFKYMFDFALLESHIKKAPFWQPPSIALIRLLDTLSVAILSVEACLLYFLGKQKRNEQYTSLNFLSLQGRSGFDSLPSRWLAG